MRVLAALVHVFTALGAVAALMAILAFASENWEAVFVWLGIAFIIDGVDGTFARWVGVVEQLPRFSGERLDLVVDYLTYVFVPTLALLSSGHLSGVSGILLACAILLSSLFHFADQESKADDYSFIGFPAVWNIVAFYIFVLKPEPATTSLIIVMCIAMTFAPMKWVHPFRVKRWRLLTLAATAAWIVAAVWATWAGFDAVPFVARTVLIAVAVFTVGLSIISTWSHRAPEASP